MHINEYLAIHGTTISLAKTTHLIRQGDTTQYCYFLSSGLLKGYYLTEDGKEFIKTFFKEGTLLGSLRSAHESIPSPFSMISIEACELIRFDLSELQAQAKTDLELSNQLVEFLIKLAAKKERREFEFLTLSAEERFISFQNQDPDLLNRVTQNDIARYIGITPVALSRIRKRILKITDPV